jgi:hypothetical protein
MMIQNSQGATNDAPARAGTHAATPAPAAPAAPETPIPPGGVRWSVHKEGDKTTITASALPPELMQLAQRAEETAFGLMGLLAAIILLGPFARMVARRMTVKAEAQVAARAPNAQLQQQQLLQLQQSVDSMSIEIERISESQRFQTKLLFEKRG